MRKRVEKPKVTFWYVYILRCGDGSLYTGITKNITERLKKHNAGKGAAYTRSHLPVTLAWKEKKAETTVRKREAEIKKLKKSEKEALISLSQRNRNAKNVLRPVRA